MPGLKPLEYKEKWPTMLLDPSHFISALTTNPPILKSNKYTLPLSDRQLINLISDEMLRQDLLDWAPGYKLNDDLVLVSRDTGRIWVPPLEEICQEVVQAHHDSHITGHLGTSGTLELVAQKYWWKDIASYVRRYCMSKAVAPVHAVRLGTRNLPDCYIHYQTQSNFITQLPTSKGFNTIYVIAN
jgi:hypothetical protein